MTNVVNSDPSLLDPERWSGIDIHNSDIFRDAEMSASVELTRRQERVAASNLEYVLRQVVAGDYTEDKAHFESRFAPASDRLPDGSVILTDLEYLMLYIPKPNGLREMAPDTQAKSDPVAPPYAQLWRNSRTNPDVQNAAATLGQEGARFPEQNIQYGRYISWGVLLTQKDGSRAVARWALGAPKSSPHSHANIYVPTSGRYLPRTATALPLSVGVAEPRPDLELTTHTNRCVSKIREVRIVYPAGGSRERQPTLKERLKAASEVVGRALSPNPVPASS